MANEDRAHALRQFRRRAMLVLYPLAALLVAATIAFNAHGSAIGLVSLVALFLLVAGWNAYYYLVWRPRFDQRFPCDVS